jgi:integrase
MAFDVIMDVILLRGTVHGFGFHDLRHQAITELAEGGTSDAAMVALAGRMSREMLEHYPHVPSQSYRRSFVSIVSL